MVADVPDTPTSGPSLDTDDTNTTQIGVAYSTVSGDGGSSILSYNL